MFLTILFVNSDRAMPMEQNEKVTVEQLRLERSIRKYGNIA
jgi:hypothetical protein